MAVKRDSSALIYAGALLRVWDADVGCLAGALLRLNLSVRRACFFSSRGASEIAAN
jgi:hypothetical protein